VSRRRRAVEVVPGITSALARPVRGIPVTHRRVSTSFTVSRSEDPARVAAIRTGSTRARGRNAVILMGAARIRRSPRRWSAGGATKTHRRRGSVPEPAPTTQRAGDARHNAGAGVESPSAIVVGERRGLDFPVRATPCSVAPSSWTRAREQASELVSGHRPGANVLELPSIRTTPIDFELPDSRTRLDRVHICERRRCFFERARSVGARSRALAPCASPHRSGHGRRARAARAARRTSCRSGSTRLVSTRFLRISKSAVGRVLLARRRRPATSCPGSAGQGYAVDVLAVYGTEPVPPDPAVLPDSGAGATTGARPARRRWTRSRYTRRRPSTNFCAPSDGSRTRSR